PVSSSPRARHRRAQPGALPGRRRAPRERLGGRRAQRGEAATRAREPHPARAARGEAGGQPRRGGGQEGRRAQGARRRAPGGHDRGGGVPDHGRRRALSASIRAMAVAQRPLVTRRDMLKIFGEDRLVAVIRTATPELAERAARAVAEGGVRLVEITLTVPDATELIAKLASDSAFRDAGAIVGAGTVLSGAQAEDALLAGARFLVSPALIPEMIAAGRARDALTMPGTLTPTEMVRAAELGADFIKIYPIATVGGPAYVANVRRALQHLPLVATGNIEYDEIPLYLKAGVVGFGIGGPLIPADLVARGDRAALLARDARQRGHPRSRGPRPADPLPRRGRLRPQPLRKGGHDRGRHRTGPGRAPVPALRLAPLGQRHRRLRVLRPTHARDRAL